MKQKIENPFKDRISAFTAKLRRRGIAVALVHGEANLKALAGFGCDNGCLVVHSDGIAVPELWTDFRYVPAARREAPWLKVKDSARYSPKAVALPKCEKPKIGYEGAIPAAQFISLQRQFRKAKFVDVNSDLLLLRAVKTPAEIAKVASAEALNDRIWQESRKEFKPGMTEKDMQRIIRAWMNALGDGEAFETIVCVGRNAAECHHVPDGTVWNGDEPLLVDMGVRLDGYCSDMTRCIKPKARWHLCGKYQDVYDTVLKANEAAIRAVRPGMTGRELDAVARKIIGKAGYGRRFGHALGHGVGLEIHELPVASRNSKTVLEPGMLVTIEPGIYIEGELGVRIEDLVLVTKDGCEVLSSSSK